MPLSLRPTVVATSDSRPRTAPLMTQNLKASEGGDLKPETCYSVYTVAGGDPVLRVHLAPDGLVVGAGFRGVGASGAESAP